MRADGLVFRVLADGAAVALVGWHGDKLPADVIIPARVSSGNDSFAVTAIEGESVLKDSKAVSISIPATVGEIAEGALSDCGTLSRIEVSPENQAYSSFDGLLFSKDKTDLLLVPEGKEGAAMLPDQTATVPALAFSQCQRLIYVEVGEGCAAYSSRDGLLYSKDTKALVSCPPGAGGAVVIPEGVESVGPGAFAGCAVASITVLGEVREISPDAFDQAAKSATVALPEGADRAVWEAAGFSKFAEPARPGDTAEPGSGSADAPEGNEAGSPRASLSFEVLEDYTLSVSWAGGDVPSIIDIPATAEVGGASYRVGAVAPAGFFNLPGLESVALPAGLSSIGEAAFAGCSELASVEIPDGVAEVGERAFEATALAEVWLPESVTSVGPRALAACASLARVVALGTPDVASSALAGCSGVRVYCPAGSEDSWNPGLPAAGNHVLPYAATLAPEPLALTAGESASMLVGGELLAPEPVEASWFYSAKPLSVDADGSATGKSEGATEAVVALTLDGVELARASRSVEVAQGEAEAQPAMVNEIATLMPSAYLAGARSSAQLNVTAPVAVTFGDGNGYDVSSGDKSVTSTGLFVNGSDTPARLASLSCADAGASAVLEAAKGAPALDSQDLFSVAPAADPSKALAFGLASSGVAPADGAAFRIGPNSSLECAYRLDLSQAEVLPSAADNGMTVKPLATLICTFQSLPLGFGSGEESDGFYLRDFGTGETYTAAEVKAHADAIAQGDASVRAAYEAFMTDESTYECKTTWGSVTYDVRVIGVNHDDKTAGGKAGLTFQFVNLLDSAAPMNGENTNAGGWGESVLRSSMNNEGGAVWSQVPPDLKAVIAPVDKPYQSVYSSTSTMPDKASSDKLFLASVCELRGPKASTSSWPEWVDNEGYQYEYWSGKGVTHASYALLKKGFQSSSSSADDWWERSAYPSDSNSFCTVYSGGYPGHYSHALNSYGVCPCFCL